ncbi:CIA30 family protein [Halomonas sp.]|jgi:monofunctional biosynthetic peptidoglycan transglycosylase
MSPLVDFHDTTETDRWRAINDDVMGGMSQGGMQVEALA